MNEDLSKEALDYCMKLFLCEKPCDSYGICEGCYERNIFLAGYNFGYRAAKTLSTLGEPKINSSYAQHSADECDDPTCSHY